MKAVKRFLEDEGIRLGDLAQRKWKGKISAWQLRICNVDGVLRTAKMALSHRVKKKAELLAVVDYLEGKLTGDELIRLVNREVDIGNKAGKIGPSHLPVTRSEGSRLRHMDSLTLAHAVVDAKIPEEDAVAIRRLYEAGKYPMRKLGRLYGYNFWAVGRILGKSYGPSQRVPSSRLKS
ncbi:MAG: hypothetical protein JRN24_01900 [Nitrososphaerota archaeon]|nr:hypothetical protein [Nitrososphaerota archaeon]